MNKIAVLVFMGMALFFTTVVFAEDYVSKNFPSAVLLERACAADLSKITQGESKIARYLGKTQNDTKYIVYFAISNPRGGGIADWNLYMLDTNLWLFRSIGAFNPLSVLQK